MKTFFRRAVLAILGTVAALALLLLAFHLIENWRGKRAWEHWKRAREAAGDSYDFKTFLPPPVPDDQNFAADPLIAGPVIGRPWEGWPTGNPIIGLDAKKTGDWRTGRRFDWEAVENELKTQDLDRVLEPLNGTLDRLVIAARKPQSRLLIDYQAFLGDVPFLLGFRAVGRGLCFRAQLRLKQGQTDAAFEDVMTGLRMAQHFQSEPYLISQLLHVALENIVLNPVQEGLVQHAWNDRQLAELQRQLAQADLLGAFRLSMRAEHCYTDQLLGEMERRSWGQRLQLLSYIEGSGDTNRRSGFWRSTIYPKGWIYLGMVAKESLLHQAVQECIDPAAHRVDVPRQKRLQVELEARSGQRLMVIASTMVSPLMAQTIRFARAQSGVDQALVACALERYRLAHRRYPDTLAELVPALADHLPVDLVNGESLRYARVGDRYRLYSVGWDLKDDGGQIVLDAKNSQTADAEQGDWVWAR